MKKEIKYIITDEDYELLRNIVIVNPCEECGDGFGGCCGCEKERQYWKAIKVYKDNNLFEAMNLVLYINNTLDNINNKTNSINYHYMKLVELGLDPNKIFDIESKNGTQLVERSIRYGKN